MAEEPQPRNSQAGSTAAVAEADFENPGLKAASKDDARAAAALDKLDARGGEDEDQPSADVAALAGAMSNLKTTGTGGVSGGTTGSLAAVAAETKKKIKVDAKDIALLVDHCELRKEKATDLLRNHEGDLKTALIAWISGQA